MSIISRTRDYYEREHETDENFVILYGEFVGQKLWVPYFWSMIENAFYRIEEQETYTFEVVPLDLKIFPELKGRRVVRLKPTPDGIKEVA